MVFYIMLLNLGGFAITDIDWASDTVNVAATDQIFDVELTIELGIV